MRYFVRVVSVLILLFYTVEGVFLAGLSAFGIVNDVPEIPFVGGGTIDGSPTPILDGIGRVLLIIGILILVLLRLGVGAEVFFLIRNFVMAIQNSSFKYYKNMSVIALISGVVNFFGMLVIVLVTINLPPHHDMESFLEGSVLVVFLANLFMEFWSLMNLLSANQCVKDGF